MKNWITADFSPVVIQFFRTRSYYCLQMSTFTEKASSKVKVFKHSTHGHRNFQRFRNRIVHNFNAAMQKGAA
ncbi:hypothetical protein HMPREF1141_1291 [Clostridium sp. MSTE9]|nr:hypothetical protein HMPREF1141_1291 [Clostridium sp. MSTE9]